eukprot:7631455-Prorocentrum_lima.AAC.1
MSAKEADAPILEREINKFNNHVTSSSIGGSSSAKGVSQRCLFSRRQQSHRASSAWPPYNSTFPTPPR